ncbi:putative hydrolase of the HAD superfamily [Agromyces flavus]|uniref:Putative hydrolase of the HAD superfamily n=1 Tax=Agromyces flavus TaxID=589382 RepID=A0A1H1URA6_9MICO|nr:hydrolase [Agromyces flavus]SDS75114.1 putative hydrolase of the HAD superfamily [Agromyces flavus]
MNASPTHSAESREPTARGAVVLFDLDDTLMAHREAVASGILAHLRERGYEAEVAESRALWHELEERHYHAYLAGELTFEQQRRARAAEFARAHGDALDDEAAGAWFARYFEHYRASWALHDDVEPAFDALERALPGVRFGIITNGEEAFQLAKLVRLGLEVGHPGRIEHVVASGSEGVTKPDARIFRAAVARFAASSPVGAAAYVGDRLRTDAIGAARAGLVGVWLNRSGERPDESDAADAAAAGVLEIRSLAELPALLRDRLVVG